MLRAFRTGSQKVQASMMRGPKKGANPATTVTPAILLLRKNDVEPEIKELSEYPAWLTNLAQPQLKMKHKIALMSVEDNLAFMPDSEDLKTLLKQYKKKAYREKTSIHSIRKGELMSDAFWDEETDELPEWYSEANILQRQIEMQMKDNAENGDEDEIVVDDNFDRKRDFTSNEQLQRIYNNED